MIAFILLLPVGWAGRVESSVHIQTTPGGAAREGEGGNGANMRAIDGAAFPNSFAALCHVRDNVRATVGGAGDVGGTRNGSKSEFRPHHVTIIALVSFSVFAE